MTYRRWWILAAGIVMQTVLGGIYAWSIFVPELVAGYGLSKGQCGTIFGLCIATFTLAMIPGGRMLHRYGPRATALVGSVLFAAGYAVASASDGRYLMLVLGISILSGAGIGFGYVCPLTVGMQWFPKHKGLITGVAVAGFGGGAILLSSVANRCFAGGMDVLHFFLRMAAVTGVILVFAALILDVPSRPQRTAATRPVTADLRSPAFLLCLLGIFVGTFAGLMVIGNLTPIVREAGLSVGLAATAVSIFAVGNAIGRVSWGFLFDRATYYTIPASLAMFGLVLLALVLTTDPGMVLACAALLGFGFGANFVIYASALSSRFDVESFPRLYPICFLGYGLAGLTGPGLGGFLADRTGSYAAAITLSLGLVAVGLAITALGIGAFRGDTLPKSQPPSDTESASEAPDNDDGSSHAAETAPPHVPGALGCAVTRHLPQN